MKTGTMIVSVIFSGVAFATPSPRAWTDLSIEKASDTWLGSARVVSENSDEAREAYEHAQLPEDCTLVYCKKHVVLSTGEAFVLRRGIAFDHFDAVVTWPINGDLIRVPLSFNVTSEADNDALLRLLGEGREELSLVDGAFNLTCAARSSTSGCRIELRQVGYYDTAIGAKSPSDTFFDESFRRWFGLEEPRASLRLSTAEATALAAGIGLRADDNSDPERTPRKQVALAVDGSASVGCFLDRAETPSASCTLFVRGAAANSATVLFPEVLRFTHRVLANARIFPPQFALRSQHGMLDISCRDESDYEICDVEMRSTGL